eukprot:5655277-Pyramimonas_sp.AAC.1
MQLTPDGRRHREARFQNGHMIGSYWDTVARWTMNTRAQRGAGVLKKPLFLRAGRQVCPDDERQGRRQDDEWCQPEECRWHARTPPGARGHADPALGGARPQERP